MNKAGKEILVKTVVQALPQSAMSIFKIPISIRRAIEQRIASFWWKQTATKAGIHWKRWETLKTRKDCRGLGFKDLVALNKAMLGKQAWRLVQAPEALWSKLIKGIYFPRGEFWNAKKGHRPSWGGRAFWWVVKQLNRKSNGRWVMEKNQDPRR